MKFTFCALLLLLIQVAFQAAPLPEEQEQVDANKFASIKVICESTDDGDFSELYNSPLLSETVKHVRFVDDFVGPSPISVVDTINNSGFKQEEYEIFDITSEWIENYMIPLFKSGEMISSAMIKKIIEEAKIRFSLDDTIHEVECPEGDGEASGKGKIIIVGDIHGQFESTLTIFEDFGFPSEMNVYIFNGDVVDRGDKSLECIFMLFAYKIALRKDFFVTRGNHESLSLAPGTFYLECRDRLVDYPEAYEDFHRAFDELPYGYIVDEQFFVCHGGLCPRMDLNFLRTAARSFFNYTNTYALYSLLWSDPCEDGATDVNEYGMAPNPRGKFCAKFDASVTSNFLEEFNLELLIRSHQLVEHGAKYCHNEKCLTIFSAPNYRGGSNRGAVLVIDEEDYGIKQMRR